jgi:hypothetical protein
MVTLIHNVLTTDYVTLIHDDDCLRGLKVLQESPRLLGESARPVAGTVTTLEGQCGISTVCNIIGSLKTAKHLGLGRDDNIVTIATDGFDRYPSVMVELERREGRLSDHKLRAWHERIFLGADTKEILDVRSAPEKARLFRQKEEVWTKFNYSRDYLERMKSPSFWEEEYARIPQIDEACRRRR